MAATVVAGSAVSAAGTTSTAAVVSSPTLPVGSASGDRVFIFASAVGTMATPTSWTQVYNVALGGGTAGAAAGTRLSACWYRDYDGVWTMPTVTAASTASNSIAGCAVTVRPGASEVLYSPTSVTASKATTGTAYTVSGASTASTTGDAVLLGDHFPSTTTTASGTLTQSGATFAALANTVVSAGTTTGNDAATAVWTTTVTTGATAAPTHAATLGTSLTGGTGFVFQTSGAATPDAVSGLTNRWVAADIGLSTGTAVSSWTARTGGVALAQATGSLQPLYQASGTVGGQPTVRYDGVDDVLTATITSLAQPYSYVVIFHNSLAATEQELIDCGTGGSQLFTNGAVYALNAGGSSISGGSFDTNQHIIVGVLNGTSSTAYLDGTQIITPGTTSGANATGTAMLLGKWSGTTPNRDWNGDFAEVVIYNRALTAADVAVLQTYYTAQYTAVATVTLAHDQPTSRARFRASFY